MKEEERKRRMMMRRMKRKRRMRRKRRMMMMMRRRGPVVSKGEKDSGWSLANEIGTTEVPTALEWRGVSVCTTSVSPLEGSKGL